MPPEQDRAPLRVDDEGLRVPAGAAGSCAVAFDGEVAWHVTGTGAETDVAWPASLRPWLRGRTTVTLTAPDGAVWEAADVLLGEERADGGRLVLRDAGGLPVRIDKWGLVQYSFGDRDAGVVAAMAQTAARMVDVVQRATGLRMWVAFGTLLGAMRTGHAIPSDSDLDLAYFSEQATPARMVRELYDVRRALVRAGYEVVTKGGSFLTVRLQAADGRLASIDVYTTFRFDGLYYATATVRQALPREAVLPLGTITFEGVELPAPAQPERVLEASYGAGWRVPDPGFSHEPGPEIVRRFEGWFGHPMRQRRDWEIYWRHNWRADHDDLQPFVRRVREDIARRGLQDAVVVDLGCGRGQAALALAADGHRVWAVDYARDAVGMLRKRAAKRGLADLRCRVVNLYDTRDALTFAGVVAADAPGPRVVLVRHLADAVPPYARPDLWRCVALLLRGGGVAHLEVDDAVPAPGRDVGRAHPLAGRRFEVTWEQLQAELRAAGLVVLERSELAVPGDPEVRHRWCSVLACPSETR